VTRLTRLLVIAAIAVAGAAYLIFSHLLTVAERPSTLTWTVYFITSAVLSVGLFFFGPIAVWSYFANLLTPVIVGLVFVIEYLVRVRVLPERAHDFQ